jgi:hypothetical protein
MHYIRTAIATVMLFTMVVFSATGQSIPITVPGMSLILHYGDKASITSLVLNGQSVISGDDGIYTSVTVGGDYVFFASPVVGAGAGQRQRQDRAPRDSLWR